MTTSNANPISANLAMYQQFTTLSIQLMQRWFELQMRAFQAVATGQGLSGAAAEWQEFIQDSMQKTLDLAAQTQQELRQTVAAQATSFEEMTKRNTEDIVQAVTAAPGKGARESRG